MTRDERDGNSKQSIPANRNHAVIRNGRISTQSFHTLLVKYIATRNTQQTTNNETITMLVKDFMTPLPHVIMVRPYASLEVALKLMVDNPDCNAIAVVEEGSIPVGIIARMDLMKAYQRGLDAKTHKISEVMGSKIEIVLDTSTRDGAAKHFEVTHHKNAFVMDKNHKFVGMVNALELCFEAARDDDAWPWNREGFHRKFALT
jgi:CBS domain-containing protein